MATVDLHFPGAPPDALIAGLAAAGDVIRNSGFSLEHLQVAQSLPSGLAQGDWRLRAAEVVRAAERAAFAACSDRPAPPSARLVFEIRRADEGV